jgi:CRISPR/Cas system CSM-associated protein Csm3 (group 7 of RAMP superfamily)
MSSRSLFAQRVNITGKLIVVSALHVGSGEDADEHCIPFSDADKNRLGRDCPKSAQVLRDAIRRPYIPGTSIKGALRALAEAASAPGKDAVEPLAVDSLFGEIKDDGGGAMGALTVFGATFARAGNGGDLPCSAKKRNGLFLTARTAIEDGRGIAEKSKLFHAEEVVPGTEFLFSARYMPPCDERREKAARALLLRLLRLIETDGFALGRGTGDGQGRVHVKDIAGTNEVLGKQGTFETASDFDVTALLPSEHPLTSPDRTILLALTCEGPFFVNDFSWDRQTEKTSQKKSKGDEDSDLPHLRALRRSKSEPILPGANFMGALRARAAWLSALARKRGDESYPDMGAVEWLFGTTDRRAALRLDSLDLINSGRPATLTSVRLDRFSGAPIDGALFGVECTAAPKFEAKLRFVEPKSDGKRAQAENKDEAYRSKRARELWAVLREDLKKNGIMLGHAANRGFGWFSVEEKAETRA